MTPIDFIAKIRPGADLCEVEKSIPAGFTVAQAALESGWGSSGLSVKAKNLFGIKADKSWHGPTLTLPTREYLKGYWVTIPGHWRSYETWADCLLDHADFFHANTRYKKALEYPRDAIRFAEEIAEAGYATDPEYAAKIASIIRAHRL